MDTGCLLTSPHACITKARDNAHAAWKPCQEHTADTASAPVHVQGSPA